MARGATSQHRREQVPPISLHSQIGTESCCLVSCRMRLVVWVTSFQGDLLVHTQDPVAIPICPRPCKGLTIEFSTFFPACPSLSLELHITLCKGWLGTWTWREVSASWVCFPLSEVLVLKLCCPGCGLTGANELCCWHASSSCPSGTFQSYGCISFFLFQFQKPGQASPLSLLLLWLACDVFVSGTNSSPILCKLPGSFCKLLL